MNILWTFIIITSDFTHGYLGNNIVSIPEQLMSSASLVKVISGEILFVVIDFTYCINETLLCPKGQLMMSTVGLSLKFVTVLTNR
jgi:hypothetical protein